MLIADLNEFVYFTNAVAYAAGRAADGTPFDTVILRATYSTGHVDNRYAANVAQARAAGLLVHHYGYLAAGDDPAAAGRFFASTVAAHGGLRPGESIWCDCEEGAGDQTPRVEAFLAAAHAVLADPVADEGEYSGAAFFAAHLADSPAAIHRWIASYGTPAPPDGEVWFQFADNQVMPGVSAPCDCSIFNGTKAQLMALFGYNAQPAPTPAPAPPAAPIPLGDTVQSIPIPGGVRLDANGWTCVDVPVPAGITKDHVIGVSMDCASAFDPQSWRFCQGDVDFAQPTPGHLRVVFKGDPGQFFTGQLKVA